MRISPSDLRARMRAVTLCVALTFLPFTGLAGQERTVVSKTVTFGDTATGLDLEFSGGGALSIAFRGGDVLIDGRRVGSFTRGGSLESAWRSLLGITIALDDGPLATALVGWLPPSGLDAESTELAEAIDRALETALTAPAGTTAPVGSTADVTPQPDETVEAVANVTVETQTSDAVAPRTFDPVQFGERLEDGINGRTLGSLLMRLDRLTALTDGLEELEAQGDEVRLIIDERMRIESNEELLTPLFLIDGEMEIAGALSADLIVLDGEVTLLEGGIVNGRIQLAQSEFLNEGGEMLGSVRTIEIDDSRIADEIARGIREGTREARSNTGFLAGPRNFAGNVGRAFGGVFGNLLTILIFGIGGWAVLYFGSDNLDAIAETSRRASGRSFTVGMAGAFLSLPAWILGVVALAISIIGIPGLLLWIPFFPVAVALAMGVGYVAVAHNLGAWLSRQRLPWFGWVRITNAYTLVLGGLVVLVSPWILANALWIGGGWFDGLRTFLQVVGIMLNAIAALIGFGALLTTRGGRKPEYWADDLFMDADRGPTRPRTARGGFDASGFESTTGRSVPDDDAPVSGEDEDDDGTTQDA